MSIIDCPACLGTKVIFNGTSYEKCEECHGVGEVEIDEDDLDDLDDGFIDDQSF